MFEKIVDEKILITGGSGFLGRYTVEKLISAGVAPTVLTRNPQAKVFDEFKGKINVQKIDLLDINAVESFIDKFQPDRIVHFAGDVYQNSQKPDILENLNYKATARLLDSARRVGVKKFVMTGTADEYGFQNAPQVETMRAMPVSHYAVSKNKAVEYALDLHYKYRLPVVVVRPFSIYGSDQPAQMFVAQAIDSAVRGTPFEMSKGEQKRDLLFVTDFVNVIIKLLTVEGTDGEIYNVGSGKAVALKTLAEKIWKIVGADMRLLKVGARPTRDSELHDTQANITKIKQLLNWEPEISLDEGLKSVIERVKIISDER